MNIWGLLIMLKDTTLIESPKSTQIGLASLPLSPNVKGHPSMIPTNSKLGSLFKRVLCVKAKSWSMKQDFGCTKRVDARTAWHLYVCMYVCMYVIMYVCMYVCVCVCVFLRIGVCLYNIHQRVQNIHYHYPYKCI